MRSQAFYPGGKAQAGVYQKIINQIPPHEVYIEAFLGAGAILRAKRPARRSIGIDRDPAVLIQWSNYSIDGLITHCTDAIEFLSRYQWQGNEVVYADPPYVRSTRSYQRDLYRFEMDDGDHARLLDVLKLLPIPVLISGYWSSLYAEALAGWRALTFNAVKRSGEVAEEWLWCNFPEPVELHDYRYLGEDFRQRERIKRKTERWRRRLDRMPLLERRALMLAISGDGGPHRQNGRGRPVSPDLTVAARAGTAENDEAPASAETAMLAAIVRSDEEV
ncbi:MAG TPA: DNA adenine methylase [Blastocatellia bacterium]|nr:DNA adenine methylase [Blastocatellia bacterium]